MSCKISEASCVKGMTQSGTPLFLHFMQSHTFRVIVLLATLFFACPEESIARVAPQKYGLSFSALDSANISRSVKSGIDSILAAGPLKQQVARYDLQRPRPYRNLTPDFYLLVALCLILGLIRYGDPRYFTMLVGAYRGTGSGRQWRELLQVAAVANLGMNIFFCAVAGAYIYYLTVNTTTKLMGSYRAPLVLLVLIAGMMLIYAGKYLVLRFSGWVFRVEALASEYIFNVFLVNKIIGIVLLPFVIVIAFAGREWVQPMAIVSGVIVLGLLATRYLRSWSAFYAFFKGSRFHFFTYLCASEILPMAVLIKWLLHLIF